jgi:hypothetical protein
MRISIIISAILIVLFGSCRGLNERMKIKKYDGTWTIKTIESSDFDSLGNIVNTVTNSNLVGELILLRDKTFTTNNQELIEFINAQGDWSIYYRSKRDVLLVGKKRATVVKRTKKELQFELTEGDGTGKISKRHTLSFEFKEDV